jgi:hypothetical protein
MMLSADLKILELSSIAGSEVLQDRAYVGKKAFVGKKALFDKSYNAVFASTCHRRRVDL